MNSDNRNVILAVVLSMIVLFGWQFFIAGPQLERAQRQAEITASQQAETEQLAVPQTNADGSTATPAAAAARRRRFMRFRSGELPTFLVTVKPTPGSLSALATACSPNAERPARLPRAALKNCERRFRRRNVAFGWEESAVIRPTIP